MPRSSIKDEEVYRRVHEEGASEQKAARIANAAARDGRSAVGKRGGESGSYEDWTVDELRERAKEIGLTGYSKLRKADLIDALRDS
ncbi:MAG TPA: Rho termination factor N-terminal domain-containing protein [Microbacterium sp.]|nr:Rho termination factor N-terminal domain-containing protein [Microbacterium sp.]